MSLSRVQKGALGELFRVQVSALVLPRELFSAQKCPKKLPKKYPDRKPRGLLKKEEMLPSPRYHM